MNLQSSKSRVNNEKGCSFKGKSTKITPAFIQNKPNSKNIKTVVSSFQTGKYEILAAWRGEKTNPIKPNSNPIQTQSPKGQNMNARISITMNYETFPHILGKKANPSKPKTKPIPPAITVPATLIIDETLRPAYNHSDNF